MAGWTAVDENQHRLQATLKNGMGALNTRRPRLTPLCAASVKRDQPDAGGDLSGTRLEFQSVHNRFRPRVLRYLKRLVGEGEAEDLTQSVMLKISEGLSGFRGDSRLSTWIYRVATNAALIACVTRRFNRRA